MTKHGLPMEERLLAQISKDPDGCWRWTGLIHAINGYGRLKSGKQMEWVHRLAYETWVGPIPDGYDVGHKCHDEAAAAGLCNDPEQCSHRPCCNPEHLKAEPRGSNLLASPLTQASINKAKTQCKRSHLFNEENTRIKKGTDHRSCKTCDKMTSAERAEWDRKHACG